MDQYRISFIGAGKVAGALALRMYSTGFKIQEIVSKSGVSSFKLADLCNASSKQDLNFSDRSDVIIAAVPDDALEGILKEISCNEDVIIAHTAGSMGLDIFPPHLKHRGVFYPLQTFSEGRCIEFKNIPFFLESSDQYTSEILRNLAESTGGKVHFADAEHRRLLHAAAVYVSNFTNHMLTAGKMIAGEAGFPFEILKPLINETILKATENGPEVSQTGPAVRNDRGTIDKHIALLSFSPDLQKLYLEITESIMSFYKNRD